jgi:diketogulonate reductase-like aldo/keto reductase
VRLKADLAQPGLDEPAHVRIVVDEQHPAVHATRVTTPPAADNSRGAVFGYARAMVERTQIIGQVKVPWFFYGTAWKEERTAALTRQALDAGFRAIDTANQRKHYFEAAAGEAVARFIGDGHATREELFLQTKFTAVDGQDHRLPYDRGAPPEEQVAQSLASSLEHLRTSYVDSLVLHGPSRVDRLSDEDWQVWRAIAAAQAAGKTRLVGASNLSPEQVAELCASATKPAFVQNRCYASRGWDREVRALCREHGVVYQGFSLLTANRAVLGSTPIQRAAARVQKTPAQVIFRFALEVGMIPLTGSSDARHLREDLDAFDFALAPDEIAAIERVALRQIQ